VVHIPRIAVQAAQTREYFVIPAGILQGVYAAGPVYQKLLPAFIKMPENNYFVPLLIK